MLVVGELIGFVDEEHASHGLIEEFINQFGGVGHVLRYHLVGTYLLQMPNGENAQSVQSLGKEPCHGGFARAGIADETEVVVEPGFAAVGHVGLYHLGYAAYALLDFAHAYIFVELGHDLVEGLAAELLAMYAVGAYHR